MSLFPKHVKPFYVVFDVVSFYVTSLLKVMKLLKANQNYLKFSKSFKTSKTPKPAPEQPKIEVKKKSSLHLSYLDLLKAPSLLPDFDGDLQPLTDHWVPYEKGILVSFSLDQRLEKPPSSPAKSASCSLKRMVSSSGSTTRSRATRSCFGSIKPTSE